jgi:hypothetical protein
MKNALYCLLIILCLSIFGACGDKVKYEEPAYSVIERDGDFELRQYKPYLIAATMVEGAFDDVGNEGFRRLFKYIDGENKSRQSISMTAPVTQEAQPEKIQMTAPVSQEKTGDKWQISFMMPSKYSMENLPVPLDSRVLIQKVPGRLTAAITYSGTWSRERYEKYKALLMDSIKKRNLHITGTPIYARYNPPFTPWFLRRNEILIPVVRE